MAAFFKLDTSGIDDGDQFQQQLLTNLLNCSVTVKANRRVTFAFYDGTAHDVNLRGLSLNRRNAPMPMKNPNHPGDIIRDCLDELGVNVTEGAKASGVTRAACHGH